MSRDGDVGRTFVELADTLVEGYDLIEFLQGLAERVVDLLDISEAGVVLADGHGNLTVLASSSERTRLLELLEVQREDGPCLDCWDTGRPVRADDLAEARDRWPQFTVAALDAGFRSAYALPLRLREERLGALNLFAERPNGLGDDDARLGQALADVATIGILHERFATEKSALADQLSAALQSRIVLEQAKGMIIEQVDIDADAAFDLIRNYARNNNRRLSELAMAITRRELSASDLAPARR